MILLGFVWFHAFWYSVDCAIYLYCALWLLYWHRATFMVVSACWVTLNGISKFYLYQITIKHSKTYQAYNIFALKGKLRRFEDIFDSGCTGNKKQELPLQPTTTFSSTWQSFRFCENVMFVNRPSWLQPWKQGSVFHGDCSGDTMWVN